MVRSLGRQLICRGACPAQDEYKFGDLTEAAVRRATGNADYKFGDFTKGAVSGAAKAVTGKDEYQFGDITKSIFKKMTGGDDNKRQ